jgi:hypothetical protein
VVAQLAASQEGIGSMELAYRNSEADDFVKSPAYTIRTSGGQIVTAFPFCDQIDKCQLQGILQYRGDALSIPSRHQATVSLLILQPSET